MIRRFLKWLRSRLALRRLSAAMREAAEWETGAARLDRVLEKRRKNLEAVRSRFDAVWAKALEDLEATEALQRQYEHAVEALRNENGVLSKVLVPSLTAAHKLILGRLDADVAIQVRRQVLVAPEEQRLD